MKSSVTPDSSGSLHIILGIIVTLLFGSCLLLVLSQARVKRKGEHFQWLLPFLLATLLSFAGQIVWAVVYFVTHNVDNWLYIALRFEDIAGVVLDVIGLIRLWLHLRRLPISASDKPLALFQGLWSVHPKDPL